MGVAAWFQARRGDSRFVAATREQSLIGINRAFFWIASMIMVLLVAFPIGRPVEALTPLDRNAGRVGAVAMIRAAFTARWASLGASAIFLYVGAEVVRRR